MRDERIEELLADAEPFTREDYERELAIVVTEFATLGFTLDEAVAKIRAHDYEHGTPFDVPAEKWIELRAFDEVMTEHGK